MVGLTKKFIGFSPESLNVKLRISLRIFTSMGLVMEEKLAE